MLLTLQRWTQHPILLELGMRLRTWRDNPDLLRRTIRNSVPAQIVVCGGLGLLVGCLVLGVHHLIGMMHHEIFGISINTHLSSAEKLPSRTVILAPIVGGALLGLGVAMHRLLQLREVVDPIEANAMHGGNMSLFGSLRLVWAAFISNVCGASVGMEAAYTQLGSGLLSAAGKWLHLRREDMRIFVAAGAAAAIASAFNSPLAGAFYGFELILGIYTVNAISQVAVAALCGTVAAHIFAGGDPIFALPLDTIAVPNWYYLIYIAEGIGAAAVGIITMQAVTKCESLSRRVALPDWLRLILGGALFGILAVSFPQVMGSGQGAINFHLTEMWPVWLLVGLLVAKIIGSVLSIGAGFRGGLFSTSLFIGCLYGKIFGLAIGHFLPSGEEHLDIFMLVGMGGIAASIVGAPVTIVLLVLEMTGNLPATTSVLMGVLVASAITRQLFGYSFSTWRFHLRGLRIQGAQDVGWVDEMSVAKLMRAEIAVAPITATLEEMRQAVGTARYLYLLDGEGYRGRAARVTLEAAKPEANVMELAIEASRFLRPGQTVQQALERFSLWETEELPVLNEAQRPIGRLKESYALRRYARELESRQFTKP